MGRSSQILTYSLKAIGGGRQWEGGESLFRVWPLVGLPMLQWRASHSYTYEAALTTLSELFKIKTKAEGTKLEGDMLDGCREIWRKEMRGRCDHILLYTYEWVIVYFGLKGILRLQFQEGRSRVIFILLEHFLQSLLNRVGLTRSTSHVALKWLG